MKSTPLYYPLDPNAEIEITLRVREYNGIDNDPAVIVREPTFSEGMALAGKLPEKIFRHLTLETEFPYDEVKAITGRPHTPLDWKEETQPLHP